MKNIIVIIVVVIVVYRVEKEENSTRQSEYIKLNVPLRVVGELPSICKVTRYTRLSICDINSQVEEFNVFRKSMKETELRNRGNL